MTFKVLCDVHITFNFEAIVAAFQNQSCYVEIGNGYIEVIPR
jgi:hypothetical protein